MAIKSADQITIVDLTDAYSVTLTNDSYVFAGNASGAVASQQSTTTVVQALRGASVVDISVDTTAITKPSGVTVSWNANTKTLTITASTSVTSGGTVTIPVSVDGGAVTINKVFSFSIAKTGASGTNAYTYIRYSENSNGSNMTDTPSASTAYIGVYTGTSSTVPAYTAFTWSKYHGEDGADGADAITMAITSSAGTIFKNSQIVTTLTAHVYKAGVEVTGTALTALGTIKWYKDGASTAESTGATKSISAGDVTNKVTYEARLEA